MSKLITRIKRLALALCLATPIVSWAEPAMNPVTGEVELYTYAYIGDATAWSDITWRDADGEDHTDFVPQVDQVYDSLVIKQDVDITAETIEGWTFNIGLFNGANLTIGTLTKWQGGCSVRVGSGSKLTISAMGGGNCGDNIDFYVAASEGIDYDCDYAKAGAFNYYFAGEGSVAYNGLTGGSHAIKSADVTLSGTKELKNKKLVSFTSTDKTFTADAAIKIKDGENNVLKTVYLTSVTAGEKTITAENDVGTCELVQTSTGIDLYWVDGDPANLPAATVYKPSININFTDSGSGLTTGADVGLTDYEVPGTSWNNFAGSNGTYGEVKAVADSSGSASVMSGVSVTVSGTRGSWATSLPSSSNPLHGYMDENANNATPTVTVTGIPYYKYRVLVYHSTDTANVPFGYDTINGTNYTYVEDALSEGTTAWGNSGPDGSADAIAAGGNVLVTEAISGSTLTVVGHRAGGDSSARGCIAAIQIIEVKADVGENDLEIAVNGETEHTVTAEEAEKTGTVYLTGSGTLTLAGEAKISAATIEVGDLVTLVVNADRLDGTTFTGAGTVVYDGTKPASGKGWTDSTWTGTVWVKNIPTSSNERKDWDLALYGNADSTLRFTGVNLYFPNSTTTTFPGTVDIDGDGMNVCDGYGGSIATFARLTGSGTLSTAGGSSNGNGLTINDASGFTGTITLTKYKVIVGTSTGTSASGVLQIESGKSITVAGATAPGGFVVNGTLVANGTLASSAAAAVTGSGTVTFGGVPSPVDGENETKWWKNAGWTGTVEIKGASITGTGYAFNDYGNAGSTVKLTNCSGWLTGGYTCVPALEIGGTFTWNDGWSNLNNTFKVGTLKGSGTISIPNQGAATAVWQITDNWSGFTGAVVGNNNAGKRVLVFGSTLPSSVTAGEIYISEGATLNLDNASGAWWGVGMGFVVDGTVKASSRSKWGGGTYMQLGDTGVLELVSTSNTDDQNTEMGNITGTGTLKFSSTAGWRAYPKTDANMPATTLTIQTEVADSLILPTKNNGETVIGNLAGSKNIRSDWSDTGADGRILTVTQSKDTEWQGKFVSNRTTQFNVVAPAEGTPGTLTLSGTQSASVPMQVNGSVNLTGTWVGATTVAGTFGGTGTLTGDLTFSEGSTLKAFSSDEDGLAVSGTVTCPEEGTVTVDVSAITPEADVALLKAANLDATKFALAEGTPEGYTLDVVEGVLTLVVPQTKVTVTVPAVENTTVTVVVGEDTIGTAAGNYDVEPDSVVKVTYAAADGYQISGTTVYTIDTSKNETTFELDESTKTAQIVAQIRTGATTYEYYTTLADALESENVAYGITLRANIDEDEVTISSPVMITGAYTISSDIKIVDGGQLQLMLVTLAGKLTIEEDGIYATGGGTLSELVTKDGAKIQLTTLSDTVAPLAVTTLSVEGNLTIISSWGSAVRGTYYKAISYVTANADIAEGATVGSVNEWSAKVEAEGDNTVVCLAITKVAVVDGAYYDDAQDAVDAAVESGKPVSFLVDPGTVTLGAGETLVVSGATLPTVELDDGLAAPYEVEHTVDTVNILNIYKVVRYVAKLKNPNVNSTTYQAEVKYTSLAEAVADVVEHTQAVYANYPAIVTLLADVTLETRVEPTKSMTIDLGGCTVTTTATCGNGSAFDVKSGNVTIKNGTIIGVEQLEIDEQTGNEKKETDAITARAGANVTLEDLTVTVNSQNGACVYPFANNDGETVTIATVTIKSGTYSNTTTKPYQYKTGWAGMAVNQANKTTSNNNNTGGVATQMVFIEGGNFSQLNPALGDDSWTDGEGTFVAAGKKAYEDTPGVWTVQNLKVFTVTFDSNGGTDVAAQNVTDGAKAATPEAPTKADNTFAGWTLNSEAYDFDTPVTGDITLVATWTPVQSGINPDDPESKQEVVIDPTGKDEDQIKEAAVEEATVTIPEAVSPEAKAAITDYKSYFELKATVTNPETGACAVEIVGFKDDVVQDVNEDAVEALKDAVADTEATTVAVEVPAGLYYVVETYEALGTPVDSKEGWSTGTTTPVDKPTGTTQGFIRVRISTAEITD